MDLGATVLHALHGAAGELQMEMHELEPTLVSEADLKRAVRRALQMQLGPFVLPEGARGFRLNDWSGRLFGPDVVIGHPDGSGHRAFAELKWCRENTMHEVLWDLLKLSLAVSLAGVEACYLIVGAPAQAWPKERWPCAALLSDGEWATRELLDRYRAQWAANLRDTKARPTRLPDGIGTSLIGTVPLHMAHGDDWELRAVRVDDRAVGWLDFEDGWPRVT